MREVSQVRLLKIRFASRFREKVSSVDVNRISWSWQPLFAIGSTLFPMRRCFFSFWFVICIIQIIFFMLFWLNRANLSVFRYDSILMWMICNDWLWKWSIITGRSIDISPGRGEKLSFLIENIYGNFPLDKIGINGYFALHLFKQKMCSFGFQQKFL